MDVWRSVPNDENLGCGQRKFEHVKEFSYLSSQMNQPTPSVMKFKPGFSVETDAIMYMGN
jgi:hypothetical protein